MGACSNTEIPFVHRMEIPQGNVVTKDMVEKLEPGLTKRQVTYIMGSPMLVDVFNQEQWIYLYSFEPSSGERVQRQLSLGFEDDALVRVSGDVSAITGTPLAVQSAEGRSRSVDVPEGVGAGYNDGGILQGVIDRFKGLNPWSGKDRKETARGNDSDNDAGEAAPDTANTNAPDAGKDTMQKFSLEEKDIGTASPSDTAQEAPAAANGGGGNETSPGDDSSKGWRLKFGSDASSQAFAPTPRDADRPQQPRPAAAPQPPKATAADDGPGFFSRLNSTLNPWADREADGRSKAGPNVEAGGARNPTTNMGAGPEDPSTTGTATIRPVLRRAQDGQRAPLPEFMAGRGSAGPADTKAAETRSEASGEYSKHRLIFDSPNLGIGDGSGAQGENAEWTIRVKGPGDESPHQPFPPVSPKSSPQPETRSE